MDAVDSLIDTVAPRWKQLAHTQEVNLDCDTKFQPEDGDKKAVHYLSKFERKDVENQLRAGGGARWTYLTTQPRLVGMAALAYADNEV
ncbi:unnamed protein product, partial [Amoebophrya sp. A120]|eukprot:GSA120T00025399001.1